MTQFINVPETVQFYYEKRANTEAIDLLLNQKNPPKDSRWEELNEFYSARLAAEKTQYDLWNFFREMAAKLWGAPLANFSHCRESDMADYEGGQRLETVWDEKEFYQSFRIRDRYFFCIGCQICQESSLNMWFYLLDENDEDLSIQWNLSENWAADDEDYIVAKDVLPVSGCKSIDLAPCYNLLGEVFKTLHLSVERTSA